ncbi:hypothetical protein BELL_0560g00070 [Botrytis elliptica]|uniref:Uncharacterized protein n=1 Tax=Botrytis elliptica TaxID=278938 RepID=A0A4Z1JJ49_9HELO|nr:hypothetical protein BELL_0560g00070 [Botrytis elliptica]
MDPTELQALQNTTLVCITIQAMHSITKLCFSPIIERIVITVTLLRNNGLKVEKARIIVDEATVRGKFRLLTATAGQTN